jgi:dihydroorotase
MKTLIRNAKLVCPVQNIEDFKDIVIEDEKILDILSPNSAQSPHFDKIIDGTNLIAAPGLVDMHTHLREPGQEGRETIATGTKAAAAGGYTSVTAMPNTAPTIDNAYVTEYVKTKAQREGIVGVNIIGAITMERKGETLAEIGEMFKAGIVGISDDGNCVMNSYVMRKAMDYCRQFDLLVIDHCEDIHLKGQGVMNEGFNSMQLGLRGIPKASEEIMVTRDIALSQHTGCRAHIAHVSTSGSLHFIREGKNRGAKVTAEVTPHHLFLTDDEVKSYNPNTKVSPPLRSPEDNKALIEGLKDGTIDAIATDHAPHSLEQKDMEFQLADSGIIGLETALPLCLGLVHSGDLTLMELIRVMSTNPAKILGIQGGSLERGKYANIVLFNKDEGWTYTEDSIVSKSKNTPFLNRKFKGKVKHTVYKGKIVY